MQRGLVGEKDLLGEAEREEREAAGDILGRDGEGVLPPELRDDAVVAQQRAGDQVREPRDEEEVLREARRARRALRHVDEVGDLREGEEGDPERDGDAGDQAYRAGRRAGDTGLPLEPGQQRHVRTHGERQQRAAAMPVQRVSRAEIGRDRGKKQHEIPRIPPGVERERGAAEPRDRRAP